jgi:hypothetical protein
MHEGCGALAPPPCCFDPAVAPEQALHTGLAAQEESQQHCLTPPPLAALTGSAAAACLPTLEEQQALHRLNLLHLAAS